MFLARREFGKALRVYPLKTSSIPAAWLYDGRHPETGLPTSAALSSFTFGGVAATGFNRSEAIANLQLAEEAAKHA